MALPPGTPNEKPLLPHSPLNLGARGDRGSQPVTLEGFGFPSQLALNELFKSLSIACGRDP